MSATSIESEANAYLDRAVLQVMLNNEWQRPISEAEVARIVSTPCQGRLESRPVSSVEN
jgi:hypothetical protein